MINPGRPRYPASEVNRKSDGWVILNFNVSVEGKAFDIEVDSSTGNKSFEKEAIRTMKKQTFKPATLNGVPVVGKMRYKYSFNLSGDKGASLKFIKSYKKVSKYIDENNRAAALELINDMSNSGALNLYEYSYLHFSKFLYARKYLTEYDQRLNLEKVLRNEGDQQYLSKKLLQFALTQLFVLQVKAKRYSEAVRTYSSINKKNKQPLTATYVKLLAIKTEEGEYMIEDKIPQNFFWGLALYKSSFNLEVISGEIEKIKLWCDLKFTYLEYDVEKSYSIPESWGKCRLQLLGKPNSEFKIYQF